MGFILKNAIYLTSNTENKSILFTQHSWHERHSFITSGYRHTSDEPIYKISKRKQVRNLIETILCIRC
jgi:hypothetical protein